MAQAPNLKLFSYFRSSASYRVRIALHWKGLQFEYIPVHLVKNGGEQHSERFRTLNPMGHVPALVHDDFVLAESMAIISYLERICPGAAALFPRDTRARVRRHPGERNREQWHSAVSKLEVAEVFRANVWLGSNEKRGDFVRHWVGQGSREPREDFSKGCAGARTRSVARSPWPTRLIIPQLFSVRRFQIDVAKYPILARVEKAAIGLEPLLEKAHLKSCTA